MAATYAHVIAANRFGLGARPGELVALEGRHLSWLIDQLQGPDAEPDALRELPGSGDILRQIERLRQERRAARKQSPTNPDRSVIKQYGRALRGHYLDQTLARYRVAARTAQPFYERLVHFWTNHFAVSADKQPLPALAGAFENEVIRPRVNGRFADMLIAAVQHPAMLMYLDNVTSVGPGSLYGRRQARKQTQRKVGLNENLAREILELHTVSVDGGYTQDDVSALACAITGWSVGGLRRKDDNPGEFTFRAAVHEPGPQTVMGTRYGQKGVTQGETVLRDLATHPATAVHVATKLARHFVADDPPTSVIARLTDVFLNTDGNLAQVYLALIEAPEAWSAVTGKYKNPHDFLLSTMRAFDHLPDNARTVFKSLETLGQPSFRPGSPAGWPDTREHWGGADALYKRIEWATAAARFAGERVDPVALAHHALGPALSHPTRQTVKRARSATQGTTLLLASPDFQRR